jgi:xanthine dehydrogenase accessory factor
MTELSKICGAVRRARERREPIWLATVMRVQGSAYRHPGARLLFSSAGVLAGSVSGGCLEDGIVRKGPWLARERPVCVRYEGGREQAEDEDEEQMPRGTGCDGIVDILLEAAHFRASFDPLILIEECLASERRAALITVFESSDASLPVGARLSLSETGTLSTSIADAATVSTLAAAAAATLTDGQFSQRTKFAGFEALLELIEPPPHLFVFGSGPDALPVAEFAAALGLAVTVCDTTARLAVRERFSGKAQLHVGSVASVLPKIRARRNPLAVVMSHHYATDCEALAMLLDSPVNYLGVLGPQRRTQRMLTELFRNSPGLQTRDLSRLRAPVGLSLGAETPEQIALSIVAEIQALLGRCNAEPLSCNASRPIHVAGALLPVPAALRLARTGTS